jgi:hypothetical protein
MTCREESQANHQMKVPRYKLNDRQSALFGSPHFVACCGPAKIPWVVAAPNLGQVDSRLSGRPLRGIATALEDGLNAKFYALSY